ncbi:MAG: pyrroline-5-carboxylate reductase [Nitrospinae bacterium]|nr:pyrroline-5-carboxylate reductase [Nitrospinota bacterium]
MKAIGLIGCGNMGEALLKGLQDKCKNVTLSFYEVSKERIAAVEKEFNIKSHGAINDIVQQCSYLLLCVKPNIFPQLLHELSRCSLENKVLISIAAGITIKNMEDVIGEKNKIVRVMPNTPALIGKGVSAIANNGNLSDEEINNVTEIFTSVGEVIEIEEKLLDAVTGVSGSGPAYVYTFIQSLVQAGILQGLDSLTAKKLAVETVIGGAEMVKSSSEHIGTLIDKVTSPGGTTISALASLEKNGFKNAVIDAVAAAVNRSKELGSK